MAFMCKICRCVNKKRILWGIVTVLILCVIAELILRSVFGFCDALLYQPSNEYEYIAQPNQKHYRFFAHIRYNSYSQRNDELDSTRVKVLGLGDSVIFGGTWMDQGSLASTLFSKETGMQMLNISCGSWGPDNCAAYLKEKGTFGAKAMILVCSSHDAYDVMSHQPVVGIYPNYPDRQYKLALWELTDRYLLPRIRSSFMKQKTMLDPDAHVAENIQSASVAKKSYRFNPGFGQLKEIADSLNIPFAIYLHAEFNEMQLGDYNGMGQEIIAWARDNDVPLYNGMECGEKQDMYRDVIHLNEKGQRHLADVMKLMTAQMGF